MSNSYCGKSCAECESRHELNCPGCKYGPGTLSGGCSIAKCCISQGHACCDTCTKRNVCQTIKAKDISPEFRLKRLENEMAEKVELARRAPIMYRWLWVLFWAYIGNIATNILLQSELAYALSVIIGLTVLVIMSVSLYKLSAFSINYKKAFYCCVAVFVLTGVVELLSTILQSELTGIIALICSTPVMALNIIQIYFEHQAHSEQLRPIDSTMADKWLKIWKWLICWGGAMCLSLIFMFIIPVFGLYFFIPTGIGVIVVSIMRIKCLYDTCYVFRDIALENN